MNRAFKKSRAEDGFTLLELLIVIVIIGILAAIAVLVFLNQQNAAHDASVKSDARNTVIGVATALVTKPDATGFSVLAPGDTTASVKLAGVPTVIVTVPTGAVAVRGVATQSNWVTVRGTGADYVVHAQSTVDGFWYEFSSKTGKYTSSSDTPAVTPGVPSSKNPVPNSVQNPNGIAVRVEGSPVTTTDGTGAGSPATNTPSGSPGNAYMYGWAPSQFPSLTEQNVHGVAQNCLSSGGYSNEEHWSTDGGPNTGSGSRALGALLVCDPFTSYDPSNNYQGTYELDLRYTMLPDSRNPTVGAFVDAGSESGPRGTGIMTAVCASSQWSLPADQTTLSLGYTSIQGDQNLPTGYVYHQGLMFASQQYRGCQYLVSFTFTAWTYSGFSSAGTPHDVSWTALQAYSPRKYVGASDTQVACNAPGATPDMSSAC